MSEDKLLAFKIKVTVKAEISQEKLSLLERGMWHCKECDNDMDANKFNFNHNGNLVNICKYCEYKKTTETRKKRQAEACQTCR